MTNAEAIRIINQYDCNFFWPDGERIPTEDLIEAFDLAVKALDAQTPRVLTLEEARTALRNDTVIWVEANGGQIFAGIRMDGEDYFTVQDDSIIVVTDLDDAKCANKYGMAWRFWSSKPTDEQRRETSWEG